MQEAIEDRNLARITRLPPPREVKARLPVSERAARCVLGARSRIRDLIHGRDPQRLLVAVGPCSIHDPAAALDFAARLRGVAAATRDRLVIVMRTYFEKPRTTVGWKGLIKDPDLDGSGDAARGLELARGLLLEINEMGLPCATEILDPVVPQYIADLLSWAAIGARTAESQTHREIASGLSVPVGFKNRTDGNVQIALNALLSAREPHAFFGIDARGAASEIQTLGNPDLHLVLRGGTGRPNWSAEDVAAVARRARSLGIRRPVLVDCSHDNSGKDPRRQNAVARQVLEQIRAGQDQILGLLLESNLEEGRQDWQGDAPLAYGVSITDACMGWKETETLLFDAADAMSRLEAPEAMGAAGGA